MAPDSSERLNNNNENKTIVLIGFALKAHFSQ